MCDVRGYSGPILRALVAIGIVGPAGFATADEAVWIDLLSHVRHASMEHSPDTRVTKQTSGGIERNALFQHPAAPGAPPATVTFRAFSTPSSLQSIRLRGWIGFRDGKEFAAAESDGCEFVVRVGDTEVFREQYSNQKWREIDIDLSDFAGAPFTLSLQTLPSKTSAADWAAWGEPRIMAIGDQVQLRDELTATRDMPPHWPLSELRTQVDTRYAARAGDQHWIGTLDKDLDLDTALRIYRPKVASPVPLGPRLVVGEGAHPDNHTLVRVLNEYGIRECQFLAFHPSVQGGVQVEALQNGDGEGRIAAAPIADSLGIVRVFDLNGVLVSQIYAFGEPATFQLVAGDFLDNSPGDELAMIRAKEKKYELLICDLSAKELARAPLSGPKDVQLLTQHDSATGLDRLLVYNGKERLVRQWIDGDGRWIDGDETMLRSRKLSLLPSGMKMFSNAFSSNRLWAASSEESNKIFDTNLMGSFTMRRVGKEESQFWIALPEEFEEEFGELKNAKRSQHVHLCKYGHIRVDSLSPSYRDPGKQISAQERQEAISAALKQRGTNTPFPLQDRMMWNPCFSHREFGQLFDAWAKVVDPTSALHKHMMQSPFGNVDGYKSDAVSKGLISATYAPGDLELQDRLFTEPLRVFLRQWSPLYRRDPGLAPSLEPNHEHEIAVAADGSVGDYNPSMIVGFYQWLVGRYGASHKKWVNDLGIRLKDQFDAPRGLGRGSWDRYSTGNPYFVEWIEYNRHVVNRTLALTYREALLAGVPPEFIHCHQIPDRLAVGPAGAGVTRISPIDYAMTCGVNYGFTRFGVNHPVEENAIAAAATSGFHGFVMGEFQPLTTDAVLAERELRYVFEQGAKAIHVLHWGPKHTSNGKPSPDDKAKNQVVYDAVKKLIQEDPPRPGLSGVTGVRAYFAPPIDKPLKETAPAGEATATESPVIRKFNIVALGAAGPALLKSVRADGSMEGSVYVTPFRQHLRIEHIGLRNTIRGVWQSKPVEMTPGSQLDISFLSRAKAPTPIRIQVEQNGAPLPRFEAEFVASQRATRHFRFQLRAPERSGKISVRIITNAPLNHLEGTLQSPAFADTHIGESFGVPHRGGVTFDVIDP